MYKLLTDRVLTKTDDAPSVRRQSGGRSDTMKCVAFPIVVLHKMRYAARPGGGRRPALIEACGKYAQRSPRIRLDRVAMRNDDSPEVCVFRPASELTRNFTLVLSQHDLHRRRHVGILACKLHDPEQPASNAAFTVDVANEVIHDDGHAVIAALVPFAGLSQLARRMSCPAL